MDYFSLLFRFNIILRLSNIFPFFTPRLFDRSRQPPPCRTPPTPPQSFAPHAARTDAALTEPPTAHCNQHKRRVHSLLSAAAALRHDVSADFSFLSCSHQCSE
jgi:hypothetical protein